MKKVLFLAVVLGLVVFFSLSALAIPIDITIGFEPASQIVPVGEPVSVDLVISGLGDHSEPSLGAFDLDIHFDPTILAFDDATFGDPDLGDQVDMSGDAALFDSLIGPGLYLGAFVISPGVLDIFEVSVDSASDLNSNQAGSFTLATLTFDTLAVGTSSLDITIDSLGDAYGNPLSADVQSGSIAPVPEPASFILFGFGLGGIGILRRKKVI